MRRPRSNLIDRRTHVYTDRVFSRTGPVFLQTCDCSAPRFSCGMIVTRHQPVQNEGMKQVVAVVKPYLAEQVLEALKRAPLEALSVAEVKGFGRQKSYLDEYAGSEYDEAFLPKVEITMWVDDLRVDEVIRKVVTVARSGRMGDGKIFVMPVTHFF